MAERCDIAVVGGGIVGLATARAIQRHRPHAAITVFEKEGELGAHQTGHNSGVIHSGIFYPPGSLKAELTRRGRAELIAFCGAEGIPVLPIGKLIVAATESETPGLDRLMERARANEIPGVIRLDGARLRDAAPGVAGVAGLSVPPTSIVDYLAVARRLGERLIESGVTIRTKSEVARAAPQDQGWRLEVGGERVEAGFVVNCAGLGSDLLARAMGTDPTVAIVPFRGDFYEIEGRPRREVHTLVYPVPDLRFPFVGVHLTPTVDGRLLAGPNAALALAREGYHRGAVDAHELVRLAEFPGLRSMLRRYPAMAAHEWLRSWGREEFLYAIQRLWPSVGAEDLGDRRSGVRAQAIRPDGTLEEDFVLRPGARALHVVNAPSPAATAAFAIGEHVAHAAGLAEADAA